MERHTDPVAAREGDPAAEAGEAAEGLARGMLSIFGRSGKSANGKWPWAIFPTHRRPLWTLFLPLLLAVAVPAAASWEAAARFGFDSNVNLSVDDPESDAYGGGGLSFFKDWSGESRFGLNLAASLDGAAYLDTSDLDLAQITLSPGGSYIPFASWTLRLSPFFQARAVKDSDQSALAFGVRLELSQRWGKRFYSGEYYIFKDTRAEAEVYSSIENGAGFYVGAHWGAKIFTDVGYEFVRGDSFTTLSPASVVSVTGRGHGKHSQYSETFEGEVVREMVNEHSIMVSLGIDWTRSLFSRVDYTFTLMDGGLGDAEIHEPTVSVGYRF